MLNENKNEVFTPDKVTKKIKSGLGNGRGTLILAIAGTVVSLAATFMFCLVSIGFDISQLGQSVFWSRWASMAISTMSVYALVVLHKDEVNRLKGWYTEKTEELREKGQKAVGDLFEEYLREINMTRRIEWYKRKMNGKIANLIHKQLRLETKPRTKKIQKKILRIVNRVEAFKARLTKDYIDKNKQTLKTRSKPISSAQVLSETHHGDNGEQNFRSQSAYYGGKSITKILLSLVMTAAFASVTLNDLVAGFNAASIVMIILTLLSVVISIVSAVLAANGCYKNVYVPNLLFKLKILSDFEEWKGKRGGNSAS